MLATHTELPSNPLVTASDREHIPSFPPEFGGDNGEFLKHYDKIQRKLDKKITALSEIIVDIPRSLSAIEFTIPRVPSGISSDTRMLKVKLPEWMSNRRALRNLETSKGDGGAVVGEVCSRYDEEKGNVDTDVKVRSVQTSPVSQDAGQPRPGRERLRSLVRTTMLRRRQAMTNPNARFWGLIEGLQWGKKAKEVRVLQVESIMRVIRISEDPSALYHAALNLRSISDPKLLALVCADETSTRGLRECYLEALEDLDKKVHSATALTLRLRETLGFGTAIFHVALSADSFDDFIQTIGIRGASLPRSTSKMSAEASRVAGEICRSAEASLRLFMSLQLRRLGAQPVELTSTTLAASALWYAINGFPHSQDILYGYRFREALGTSQVSWACLGLLACVSNIPCRFHDARKKKPYGMTEINWCREAFLRVRDAYHSSEPTQELAAAIGHSFSTGKNLETNTALFIFTWRLFAKNDHGKPAFVKLGENALSAGKHLICTIEKSIRSSKNDEIYRKHAELRERFFKVMMDCMGHRDGEIKALKGVLWRHRLTLITATAYMEYIMGLEGPVNKRENARAEEFMQRIRDAQIQNFRTSLAMDQDYADARHAFEGVISKFGVHDGAASVILDDSAAIVSIVDSPNDLRP
ncbi:hypothetical protein FRC04_009532 [Tulasnella sp. 424]|nr:hypothetical protein FRC04_009532 [Tulasnella sp. 424]